ncbi:MAG: hypothetical protein ACHQIM_22250 [Sphingobacteriales bacterium]
MNKCLLLILLLSYQFISAQKKGAPVKILDATAQNWAAGAPGGKSGTVYNIKVKIMTAEPVEFKNLWLEEENVPFNLGYYTRDGLPKILVVGDSVLLTYNKTLGEKPDTTEKKRVPIRIEYKWAALIECLVHGKARYFIVKRFTEIPRFKGQ